MIRLIEEISAYLHISRYSLKGKSGSLFLKMGLFE